MAVPEGVEASPRWCRALREKLLLRLRPSQRVGARTLDLFDRAWQEYTSMEKEGHTPSELK